MSRYFWIALGVWNLIVFFVYGLDKYKAKNDKWRIPEKTLMLLAFFFGGLGAACGCFTIKQSIAYLRSAFRSALS